MTAASLPKTIIIPDVENYNKMEGRYGICWLLSDGYTGKEVPERS